MIATTVLVLILIVILIVNTLLWNWVMHTESGTIIMNPAGPLPFLVTLFMSVVLSRTRHWVMMGILGAVAVNAIALILFPAPTTDILLPTENSVFIRHL